MKGYKVFNPDWTCRGYQYKVGKTYKIKDKPILCERGFHFCERLIDCFKFYDFTPDNKVAEVEVLGEVVTDGKKSCTNLISIVRELPWGEVLTLVNTGNRNTGDRNTGDCNTGSCNTGNRNTGNRNTGNRNTGNRNTGDCNTGNWNTGDRNTGNWNTGNCNTGDRNTGNRNTGNWNTGNWNTGDRNTGNWNTGNCNTGNCNTGNRNTGNWNTGNWNSGDFNSTDDSNGCFNTQVEKIRMFNKESDWTLKDWRESEACAILQMMPSGLKWVVADVMTDEEKAKHPEAETTGGYLKEPDNAIRQEWWDSLIDKHKVTIKSIPNFDSEIFEQITGIKV